MNPLTLLVVCDFVLSAPPSVFVLACFEVGTAHCLFRSDRRPIGLLKYDRTELRLCSVFLLALSSMVVRLVNRWCEGTGNFWSFCV